MFPDAGPTARALLALELLQSRPGLTAAELAERLQVSERAARRTVATLREAGVPVDAAPGRGGGYRLGRGLRLPPLVFSASEAWGLVMAVLDGSHAAADPDDPVGAALGKLVAAMPASVGRHAAQLRAHAAAAPDRRAVRPDHEVTRALVGAVAAAERVRVSYRSEAGREWDEQVDPWGVVVRHGRWYLLCHSHRVDAVRTYRLDRIGAVEGTGQTFEPPADLDVVAATEDHLGVGWDHPVRVVFEADVERVRPWVGAAMGSLEPLPGQPGRCVLQGTTSNPEAYAADWLAPILVPFRVEGGDELREAMGAIVRRLAGSL